jgi:N-acetylmuramoyl-L-alanine amidase
MEDKWVPLQRWSQAQGFALQRTSTATWELHSATGTATIMTGRKILNWSGHDVFLGFAPVLINEQPFVHRIDVQKTLQPLLGSWTPAGGAGPPLIVLDPGHGGNDAGTRSALDGQNEKELTLDWAKRVAARLSESGLRVVLTHTNDSEVTLSNRVAFAERVQASAFVSLHFNAVGGAGEQSGLETYCLTPVGVPSTITRGYDEDPKTPFPNNRFDVENLRLACLLHGAVLRASGAHDRGVRRARFLSSIRAQNRPAALLEGGYLSNASEARKIANPEYRERLAQAVAEALLSCFSNGRATPINGSN